MGNAWLNVAFYVDDSTLRRCRARGQVKMASGDHHDWAGGRHGQDPKREPRLWAQRHRVGSKQCKNSWCQTRGINFSLSLTLWVAQQGSGF